MNRRKHNSTLNNSHVKIWSCDNLESLTTKEKLLFRVTPLPSVCKMDVSPPFRHMVRASGLGEVSIRKYDLNLSSTGSER